MAKKKAKNSAIADKNLDFSAPWIQENKKTPGGSLKKLEKGKKSAWVDDGSQFRKDAEDDKKMKPKKLTERGTRPAAKMISITCERCRKDFEVNETIITSNSYYICEGCITKRPLVDE